jgi:hypothetical protein
MKLEELERRLFEVARAEPPSDRVPLAFEQRVMAHLRARPMLDVWEAWSRALWRAVVPCVAITLLLGAWSLLTPASTPPAATDLSQELDNTVLAAVDQDSSADVIW